MGVVELHEFKHDMLEKRLDVVEVKTEENKTSINNLEKRVERTDIVIEHFSKSIESLIAWIKIGITLIGGATIGFLIWGLQQTILR